MLLEQCDMLTAISYVRSDHADFHNAQWPAFYLISAHHKSMQCWQWWYIFICTNCSGSAI